MWSPAPIECLAWRHVVVWLKPDFDDPSFEPIEFKDLDEGELSIIAEPVGVLG